MIISRILVFRLINLYWGQNVSNIWSFRLEFVQILVFADQNLSNLGSLRWKFVHILINRSKFWIFHVNILLASSKCVKFFDFLVKFCPNFGFSDQNLSNFDSLRWKFVQILINRSKYWFFGVEMSQIISFQVKILIFRLKCVHFFNQKCNCHNKTHVTMKITVRINSAKKKNFKVRPADHRPARNTVQTYGPRQVLLAQSIMLTVYALIFNALMD